MSQWDTFSSTIRRAHDNFQFREVRVYQSSATYDSDTGNYEQTYTEHANSPIEMEVREPQQPRIVKDAEGAEAEVNIRAWAKDDVGIDFTGADENPDWPDKIRDTTTGQEYRIYRPFTEGNGLIKMYGVSIG